MKKFIGYCLTFPEKIVNVNEKNKIIGFEKNSKGKLSPRQVSLASDMDPAK